METVYSSDKSGANTFVRYLCMLALLFPLAAPAQVFKVDEMNASQLASLDKNHTAVILVGGIIEQHGPHLPSGTDTMMNEWWARTLAEAIAKRPGWKALVFPTIPLGTSGANVLGGRYSFPGSYTVRPETERAAFMDLASELGEQGYRWIFVVHNHGSPLHNLMLDQAGDYFHDTYGGRMVNLAGLLLGPPAPRPLRSAEAAAEDGEFEVHAGMSETSRILFLRPDLVAPGYAKATPHRANSPAEAVAAAKAPQWEGYIGSPRQASAAFGEQELRQRAAAFSAAALSILDGADPRKIPRLSEMAMKNPDIRRIEAGTQSYYDGIASKQAAWLEKQKQ
jgi:creatinine amidohydrolase/Fe(II)-dependent formamide hydrolase-like protein